MAAGILGVEIHEFLLGKNFLCWLFLEAKSSKDVSLNAGSFSSLCK